MLYPGVENYLDDYFNSIYSQTTNDFDLLIIEDKINLPKKFLKARTKKKLTILLLLELERMELTLLKKMVMI